MISIPFDQAMRETSDMPLTDPVSGVSVVAPDGRVVTLTLRWPDDPAMTRVRGVMLGTQAQVEHQLLDAAGDFRPEVDPEVSGRLLEAQDAAISAYAAALVVGWTLSDPCTPEAVRSLFVRFPFVRPLILKASGEQDRFLPPSLRPSPSVSAAPSEALA